MATLNLISCASSVQKCQNLLQTKGTHIAKKNPEQPNSLMVMQTQRKQPQHYKDLESKDT
jgi:hypothetical protein